MYNDSIEAAKKSGFIHEQGLACEKAAFYFMRIKKEEKAVEYFKQARECYESWGSVMKVDFIQKELDGLQKVRGGKSNWMTKFSMSIGESYYVNVVHNLV